MHSRPWRRILSVGLFLAVAAVLLTGCPETPALASGASGAASAPGAGGPADMRAGGPGGVSTAASHAGGAAAAAASAAPAGTVPAALASPKEFVKASVLRDVHFDFDKYAIRTDDVTILDTNARWLKSNPKALLLIEGHADERGTNEYNLALGDRRAKATRDSLVSLGVDAGRISTVSYGEERPLCIDRTEACWTRNRRGHFLVKP